MVGKKRTLRPASSQKVMMTIARTMTGTLGPLANNPIMQYIAITFAMNAANSWQSARQVATDILRKALGKLGRIPPMDHAEVNALASAASKVILDVWRGTFTGDPCTYLDSRLREVAIRIGAPQEYANAVADVAKTYLRCTNAKANGQTTP